MSEDVIVKNEIMDDGKTVHLYFSDMYQEYVAYGFSAYIACESDPTIVAKPLISYSTHFQMPEVRIDEANLQTLRHVLLEESTTDSQHLCFSCSSPLDETKYESWAHCLRG